MKIRGALVLAALAAAAMVIYARTERKIPFIPRDIFHTIVINSAACTTCHTPGKQAPLKVSHPPKVECMVCHKAKQARPTH